MNTVKDGWYKCYLKNGISDELDDCFYVRYIYGNVAHLCQPMELSNRCQDLLNDDEKDAVYSMNECGSISQYSELVPLL